LSSGGVGLQRLIDYNTTRYDTIRYDTCLAMAVS